MHEYQSPPIQEPSREQLREQGYGLINKIGDGAKPIVLDIEGTDVSTEKFLTTAQLEEHRKEVVPEGLSDAELELIAQDMENFIYEIQARSFIYELFDPESRVANSIRNLLVQIRNELGKLYPELQIAENRKAFGLDADTDAEDVAAAMAYIKGTQHVDETVLGIPISDFTRRGEGLSSEGAPCPCLGCSHIFTVNAGIVITDASGRLTGEPGKVRINSIVAHLASHGISNKGNGSDPTQRYMTIKEYLPLYEQRKQTSFDFKQFDYKGIEQAIATKAAERMLERMHITSQVAADTLQTVVKNKLKK